MEDRRETNLGESIRDCHSDLGLRYHHSELGYKERKPGKIFRNNAGDLKLINLQRRLEVL